MVADTIGALMIYTDINTDSDGVLYDFTTAFARMDGYDYVGRWFEMIQSKNMTLFEYMDHNGKFDTFSKDGLFKVGNPCNDANRLLNHLYELRNTYNLKLNILSALPYNKSYVDIVRKDKMEFFERMGILELFDNIILCNGSKDKLNYANKHSILIDDFDRTETRFKNINAPFILHRSFKDTKSQLDKYGLSLNRSFNF